MSDQPQAAVPPQMHENPVQKAGDWFRHHEADLEHAGHAAVLIADELKPVLQDHASGLFALASKVFADPELKALAPDVLALVISAARIAGVAL